MELEQLDSLVAEENKNLGFAMFFAGVFVTTILSWLVADRDKLSTMASLVHLATMIATGPLAVFFMWGWHGARKHRPRLLEVIRARSTATLKA